jgi:phospholipid/cholesterol/gamma-HCH transport system substrate-binding protein
MRVPSGHRCRRRWNWRAGHYDGSSRRASSSVWLPACWRCSRVIIASPRPRASGRATTRAVVLHIAVYPDPEFHADGLVAGREVESMQQIRAVELGTGSVCLYGHSGTVLPGHARVDSFDSYTREKRGYDADRPGSTRSGRSRCASPVSISGVPIGRVTSIEFDVDRLEAVVTMRISSRYNRIPIGLWMRESSPPGILGGQYVGLQPGGSDEFFRDGDEIELTQSAVVLEQLISKYLFDQGGSGD